MPRCAANRADLAPVFDVRLRLTPRALSMFAAGPAARPALPLLQLLLRPADATRPGRWLLGILDPADELVASQRSDVHPRGERRAVPDQRLPKICGKLVHDTAWNSLGAHGANVERNALFANGRRKRLAPSTVKRPLAGSSCVEALPARSLHIGTHLTRDGPRCAPDARVQSTEGGGASLIGRLPLPPG